MDSAVLYHVEQACELLSSAEKDRELKLVMETKLIAVQAQVRQDASTLAHIRKERDSLHLTVGQLRSKRKTAHGECDIAPQQVFTLQAELREEQNRKLKVEATVAGLSGDLRHARARLQALKKEVAEVRVSLEEVIARLKGRDGGLEGGE
jgi:chromosome segregation ATPase